MFRVDVCIFRFTVSNRFNNKLSYGVSGIKHRILWKLSLRKFPVIDETIYIWMATYPYYPVDHLFGYLMCGKKHLIKLTINDVN